jgi:hypothetical protein
MITRNVSNKELEGNSTANTDYTTMEMRNIQPFSNLSLLKATPIIREAPAILAPSAAYIVKPGSED